MKETDGTDETLTLWTGRFLEIRRRESWEYVTRLNAHSVVAIAAVTCDNQFILIEQFRRAVGQSVIELPAGLAGDDPGCSNEDPLLAAQRELLEETGFTSKRWTPILRGPSSAGLTDEIICLYLAEDAVRESAGGGVDSENITVHTIPLEQVEAWIDQRSRLGALIDLKILSGLQCIQRSRR